MALKEDYKDAVFAGLRKYKMLDNGDGTVSLVDMTECEAAGDKFGAKDVNAITKTVNATGEIIADDNDGFKPDQKYVIGDIVIYDNKTWRFKVDHEPGEWDESQVERTNILAVIAEQNKNLKVDGDMTIGEMIEKIYNAINSRNTYQLKTIGVIDGNGSFSIPDGNKKSFIIAIPTEVKVSTNGYGNCRLDGSFYGTSPSWEYNENDKVVTTSKSIWTICNDSGSIITGSIRWTIYAIE